VIEGIEEGDKRGKKKRKKKKEKGGLRDLMVSVVFPA